MQRFLFSLGLFCLCTLVWASARYPFEHPAQQAQFQALLHDLRCPVCQNQDLADSNAALAADLRDEVYHLVLAHYSDQEIIGHLTQRYGNFIVFKPPVTILTSVLWFGPVLLLLIGLGVFAMVGIRRVQHD
ncbi:MAG: cytochrome c-type biogenesis protein CcmH [Legionellales bacterium]|nr:cytochrome c-type biogenesis protein CcmH [Legionellales bacterium]